MTVFWWVSFPIWLLLAVANAVLWRLERNHDKGTIALLALLLASAALHRATQG